MGSLVVGRMLQAATAQQLLEAVRSCHALGAGPVVLRQLQRCC